MLFSEYINSKERLREAVKVHPQQTVGYNIRRACRLMIQNSEGKQYLPLNIGHIVKVIWLYENRKSSLPVRIFFKNVKNIDEDSRFYTSWSGDKLEKWLNKNSFLI